MPTRTPQTETPPYRAKEDVIQVKREDYDALITRMTSAIEFIESIAYRYPAMVVTNAKDNHMTVTIQQFAEWLRSAPHA